MRLVCTPIRHTYKSDMGIERFQIGFYRHVEKAVMA